MHKTKNTKKQKKQKLQRYLARTFRMAHFIWIVKAFSPRDGGWVRMFGAFRSEEAAWTAVTLFWDMMVRAGDYQTIKVVKTIAF